jgi:hypothetical protein
MMIHRAMFCAVLAAGTLSAQSTRRDANERAVRAVVDSFFNAVEHERWDAAATFVDTTRFAAYVRMQTRNARAMIPQRPVTAEELMARDTTMPRAVAEWQVKRYEASMSSRDPFAYLTHEFLGVKSPQELSQLTTAQALARWMAARDPRSQMREATRLAGCPDSLAPRIPFDRPTVHGVAFDGDTTAYVIVRQGPDIASMDMLYSDEVVMALHPRGRTWRIEPREQLHSSGGLAMVGFSGTNCRKR